MEPGGDSLSCLERLEVRKGEERPGEVETYVALEGAGAVNGEDENDIFAGFKGFKAALKMGPFWTWVVQTD